MPSSTHQIQQINFEVFMERRYLATCKARNKFVTNGPIPGTSGLRKRRSLAQTSHPFGRRRFVVGPSSILPLQGSRSSEHRRFDTQRKKERLYFLGCDACLLDTVERIMAIPEELLDILVCPACKAPVKPTPDNSGLKCQACRRVYPVSDEIPVMLITERTSSPE